MAKKGEKILEYHPPKGIRELDGTKPLTNLVNEEFIITDVKFFTSGLGEIAKVTVKERGDYRTTSQVLLKQLKQIKQMLDEGADGVKVKLSKRKRYYTFE